MKKQDTTAVIIPHPVTPDLFLGVSRKYDYNSFGFAGGKCDVYENPYDCARRETSEETGFHVTHMEFLGNLEHVNDTVNPNTLDNCYFYVTTGLVGCQYDNDYLISKGEGVLKWVTEEELFNGAFGEMIKEFMPTYHKWKNERKNS